MEDKTMLAWMISDLAEKLLLKRRLKQVCGPTMRPKETIRFLSAIEYSLHEIRPSILFSVNQLLGKSSELRDWVRVTAFKFLLDRLTSTPINIIRLATKDPVMAGPDVASLYRSMFESTVNLLYLLNDSDESRFAAFYLSAYEAEHKMYEAVEKWKSHSDPWIARYAEHQLNVLDPPCKSARDEMIKILECSDLPPKFPKIYQRCKELGPTWEFLYDAMYRGLSAWQHGDMSRSHISSSMLLLVPEYAERTVFETMIVVMWTWELTYRASHELFNLANQVETLAVLEKLNACCHDAAAECLSEAAEKFHFSKPAPANDESFTLAGSTA
jgi:hypothetical protein